MKITLNAKIEYDEGAVVECPMTLHHSVASHFLEGKKIYGVLGGYDHKFIKLAGWYKHDDETLRDSFPEWKTDTPPKDGNPFIARVKGYPWPVFCVYNAMDGDFCRTYLTAEGADEDKMNIWFENEWELEKNITAWMPCPEPLEDSDG